MATTCALFMLVRVARGAMYSTFISVSANSRRSASENAPTNGGRAYVLTVGDATDESIMRFLFVPKTGPSGGKGMAGRQDYRLLKKRKQPDAL